MDALPHPHPTKERPKPISDAGKRYLEKWYADLGSPAAVSNQDKKTALNYIQQHIDPEGVKISQLNSWLRGYRKQRRVGKDERRAVTGIDKQEEILFPELTAMERRNLRALLREDPNPSDEVIHTWMEAPTLKNLTKDITHRFKRHLDAQRLKEQQEAALKSTPHYPTPSSASPEPFTPVSQTSPVFLSTIPYRVPLEAVTYSQNNGDVTHNIPHANPPPSVASPSSHQLPSTLHSQFQLNSDTQNSPEPPPRPPILPPEEVVRIPQPQMQYPEPSSQAQASLHQRRTSIPIPTPEPRQVELPNLLKLLNPSTHADTVSQLPSSNILSLLEQQSKEILQLIQAGKLRPFGLFPNASNNGGS